MNDNLSLGRIAGVHLGLNWSLLVVAGLIAWSLATGLLPAASPGQTSGAYWTAGIVSAFVYLACLLAHELAHSVVAMRRRRQCPTIYFGAAEAVAPASAPIAALR